MLLQGLLAVAEEALAAGECLDYVQAGPRISRTRESSA
jgi:hypothetical protein